jgi:hypothetical protein
VNPGHGGLFDWIGMLKDINGYIGSWPEAGMLSRILGINEALPEGEVGYREILLRLGIWGMKLNDFTVVALNQQGLAENVRQLRIAEATKPAQIRIQVEDLRGTHMEKFLAQLGYRQAWTGSTGNARYLHRLAEQFQIPRADALPLAQDLCGAKLIDPLAGQYKLVKLDSGLETWTSSAWKNAPGGANSVPDGYSAAPLLWFRGLNAEATLEPGTLSIRAELTVERKAGGISLPSFFGQ